MKFKFNNYSQYTGKYGSYDWFKWKIFMDEPIEKLDKVESVEYRLHETFPNPIRTVEDRDSRFALRAVGWGEFKIFITVYLKDGTEVYTEYDLDLGKSWPRDDLEKEDFVEE
jgi:transcription initiation factor IIF auxiliary subunit